MPETVALQDALIKIISETKDENQIIEKGNEFFDGFYSELEILTK